MKYRIFIRKILAIILISIATTANAETNDCRKFSHDQIVVLYKAYNYGWEYDLGYSLAAIVMQESFVGDMVVRINPHDGNGQGSYGITHILLNTAMWLEGEHNKYKAQANIIPKLMVNDDYALELALRKLQIVKTDNWIETWNHYNGASKNNSYGKKISENVKMLKQCKFF